MKNFRCMNFSFKPTCLQFFLLRHKLCRNCFPTPFFLTVLNREKHGSNVFFTKDKENNKRLKKSHKESDEILGSREVNFDYPYSVVLFKYLIKA